jgi:hypothetical protein
MLTGWFVALNVKDMVVQIKAVIAPIIDCAWEVCDDGRISADPLQKNHTHSRCTKPTEGGKRK